LMDGAENKKPAWETRHAGQASHPGFTSEFSSSYLFSFLLPRESPPFGFWLSLHLVHANQQFRFWSGMVVEEKSARWQSFFRKAGEKYFCAKKFTRRICRTSARWPASAASDFLPRRRRASRSSRPS